MNLSSDGLFEHEREYARRTRPLWHQKHALLTSIHMADG